MVVSELKITCDQGGYKMPKTKLLIAGLAALFAASSIPASAYLNPVGKPAMAIKRRADSG